ncbi:MAG: hypothetical protein M0P91_04720 [Sulfuricurvum sp.]|jgi:hypothetical protein|uniref:hypothetical protein n=1 Tax=Sulfuricurvum sp. TaxID=2025608 RepID=UPI0025F1A3C2|nr:hypothetical protein [Sulfuricurvum sp.]MCK9372479.1 hypothetical protein [Sulfuricurvum sp.]
MISFNDFIELLENYVSVASEEYSEFERTRHSHFVFEGLEGSHKKSIKHWMKVLDTGTHSNGLSEEMMNIGESIVERATTEIKAFYFGLLSNEDKVFFLQILMKKEMKLLKLDLERYKNYKNGTEEVVVPKKQAVKKPVVEKIVEYKNIVDEATIKALRAKEFITVKEFTILYNMSTRTQATLRARRRDKNPLPCVQLAKNGTVKYKLYEVEIWFENERR